MQAVPHCSDMCRLLKARILSCSWRPITSPRWNSYLHFLLPSNEEWNVFPLLCRQWWWQISVYVREREMVLIPNGLKISITRENQVGTTIAACDRLHGAWQQHQRQVSRQNFFFGLGQKISPENDFLPKNSLRFVPFQSLVWWYSLGFCHCFMSMSNNGLFLL